MERPVELEAAGNPRTQNTDQRRLDDMLAIEKVVAGGFVLGPEYPPSQLRKNADAQEFVFQPDERVFPVLPVIAFGLHQHPVRVWAPARPLVDAVLRKHRHGFQPRLGIGRDC